MRRSLVTAVVVLAVLVVSAATAFALTVAGDRDHGPGYGMHQKMGGPATLDDRSRSQRPRGWMHGSAVDTEFAYLTEMVAHHGEAVAAARALQRSSRPEMRAFGRSIVTSQSAQIEQMNGWLAEWYPGRSTENDYQPMMRDLSGLSRDELDRAFLQDMIPHHMMAVMMSQQLMMRGVADHDQVNVLAQSIRDEQHAEILEMRRWLGAWFDVGWTRGMGHGMRW